MANRERIKLLVDALRSGKYRQGTLVLSKYYRNAKKRKLCCLGVACEIAQLSGLEVKVTDDGTIRAYDGAFTELPHSVRDWFGFDSVNPELVLPDESARNASWVNDQAGYKFGAIADAFERTYL